ncbi:unnamed protein product [Closterium sp. NIES-54]
MKNCQIILGSSSQSRQQVLREIGVPFEIMKPGIDEEAIRSADPHELVSLLSRAKADALLAKLKAEGRTFLETADVPTLLITADQAVNQPCSIGGRHKGVTGRWSSGALGPRHQVVVHEDRILEKPLSEAEAREFIRGYSRAPARTVGAVLVTNLNSGKQAAAVDVAEVHFRAIPDSVIDQLVAEGDIFYCAGGLMGGGSRAERREERGERRERLSDAGGLMVEHPLVAPLMEKMVSWVGGKVGVRLKQRGRRGARECLSDAGGLMVEHPLVAPLVEKMVSWVGGKGEGRGVGRWGRRRWERCNGVSRDHLSDASDWIADVGAFPGGAAGRKDGKQRRAREKGRGGGGEEMGEEQH